MLASPERYQALEQVTDVAGLRVVTYFADDVESVGRIIRDEFEVIEAHSSNKRDLLSDGEFGYLSLHYTVRLERSRVRLAEYANTELLAELQVRSILQHAWAEIEHDLGYKTPLSVPRHVRREFARLAALLEGADDSFVALRNLLHDYDSGLGSRIRSEPDAVDIDVASLRAYLRVSDVVSDINTAVGSPQPFEAPKDVIARHVRELSLLGVETIGQLDEQMRSDAAEVIFLGRAFRRKTVAPGSEVLSVVYLEYLLLTRCRDEMVVHELLKGMPSDFWGQLTTVLGSLENSVE